MPALKMKTKSSMICSIQPIGLGVCKSSKISKTSCSQGRISQQAPSSDTCVQNEQDVSSKCELSSLKSESDEAVDHQELDHQELFDGEIICLSPGSTLAAFESSNTMEFLPSLCNSDLETIFSPIFESLEDHGEHALCNYSVGSSGLTLGHVNTEEDCGDRIGTSCYYQTCNISDFHIADMTVNDLPFNQSTGFNDIVETNPFPDYDMMFDITERYMILPVLEESVETGNAHDDESSEVATMSSDEACLYLAIQQISSLEEEPEVYSQSFDPDEADGYDPHMYIRNLADLSEVVPSFWSMVPKETRKRKPITLVLDLDETLVHSTLDRCDDADFTFSVFFNMKEHTVYVRRRPYLQTFLERAAEMFEVMIFTASQSIYAEKLLNILDPEKKLISRCAYRESCIFSDGTYTKDLTVLGVDLAKVAIIDNSPQVFRLQVNNGIPIKSWFDDPSDRALISLLPFLEALVDADDVRPIIAKRYNNKE